MCILYAQIDRDEPNFPHFIRHALGLDLQACFLSGESHQAGVALLVPKKLNKLEIDGADRDTPLRIDGALGGQTAVAVDAKALEGVSMIEHYVDWV